MDHHNHPAFAADLLQKTLALLMLALVLVAVPIGVDKLLRRFDRLERNFRGERIPVSYGLSILLGAALLLATFAGLRPRSATLCAPWIMVIVGFGLLGFIDDTWGDKKIKGLRGHFRAALRDHRITTGFVKAMGGALLALCIGRYLYPASPVESLLATGLIALSANAVNLLDLRPGRASAVFLACATLILLSAVAFHVHSTGLPLLLCVMVPTVPAWGRDSSAKVMLGDTGSNLLGASLGLAVAEFPGLPAQIVVLMLLIGLHILAERVSLTALIEKNRALRALDRLTGVR